MYVLKGKPASEFNFKEIKYDKKEMVATVTINREDVYNAYSTKTLEELFEAFKDAAWDDSVGVVVLTGAGKSAFCTGGDVKEYAKVYTEKPHEYWKYLTLFAMAHDMYRNIGKPTIARLNGIVVGGGNEWNLSSDLAVIGEHGYIRQVGTSVGSVACGGATQILPIVVGDRRAREILWFNEEIKPQKALEWGLVNQIAETVTKNGKFLSRLATEEEIQKARKKVDGYDISLEKLDEIVATMCKKLLDKFPECQRYTKEHVNFWKNFVWYSTIGHAREWLALHFACREPYEGMKAFVEKRKVDYLKLRRELAEGGSSEFVWGPLTKKCPHCGASGIPSKFLHCGLCGTKI